MAASGRPAFTIFPSIPKLNVIYALKQQKHIAYIHVKGLSLDIMYQL